MSCTMYAVFPLEQPKGGRESAAGKKQRQETEGQ